MRGERIKDQPLEVLEPGSSPHARGTRFFPHRIPRDVRIIPACAGNAFCSPRRYWARADHPRMRGERGHGADFGILKAGSSPHARGTRADGRRDFADLRIIPACAGNARSPRIAPGHGADHPRMRGERHRADKDAIAKRGSSPHARGTPGATPAPALRARIIPACAGNAALPTRRTGASTDHPRMRGERGSVIASASASVGSSPHARGTPRAQSLHGPRHRIIPACAGNAASMAYCGTLNPDHPRMRGERCAVYDNGSTYCGSSPHARGTRRLDPSRPPLLRIIPACAGNARIARRTRTGWTDHPRMRGERPKIDTRGEGGYGSSPHARGTRRCDDASGRRIRIIPACAGNARTPSRGRRGSPDHPRMRGERACRPRSSPGTGGSSPHARGTLDAGGVGQVLERIIPACAGNATWRTGGGISWTDHPRMRGERLRRRAGDLLARGSSPHARGTRDLRLHVFDGGRIIPACAGNAGTCTTRCR